MPRNMSAWMDICAIIIAAIAFSLVILLYNFILGMVAVLMCIIILFITKQRCKQRAEDFEEYCDSVIKNIKDVQNYATSNLPMMILVIDRDYHIQWFNKLFSDSFPSMTKPGVKLQHFMDLKRVWPEIKLPAEWKQDYTNTFIHNDCIYSFIARPIEVKTGTLMALYVADDSIHENMKNAFNDSRAAIAYIQIDCFDEVFQGISEAERNTILFSVDQEITSWASVHNGFIKKITNDIYMAIMDKQNVKKAMEEKFDILDKIRAIPSTNRRQVTLSIGVAVVNDEAMDKLGEKADYMLTMALSRGGDQAAVHIDDANSYFGAKTQAVERTTRAKARSMSHNIHNMMDEAEEIFVMGHSSEDFDALGAAMGIVAMARHLKKPVYVVLSQNTSNIAPLMNYLISENSPYHDVFINASQLNNFIIKKALLFVVDTQLQKMLPSQVLLSVAKDLVIIDHHRRNEGYIDKKSTLYLETSMSSTCEMVTELITYFDDELKIDSYIATSLYSGIKVDTKNFTVNTGARTFDAASFLRRSGANPVKISSIFATDYTTDIAKARAKSHAKLIEGGLVTTYMDEKMSNIQVAASQVADELLQSRDVHVTIVAYNAGPDTVGISARSDGDVNVQLIMEYFGGGGHQNVAGARVVGSTIQDVYEEIINVSKRVMKENAL